MNDVIDAAMNVKFMDDAVQGPHAAFEAEQQHRWEAVAVEELDDDDDWSGPNLDE
jgi:hypothetical protein